MQYRYAVLEPATAGNLRLARVVSRHSMLHKALEARTGTRQVRELVAPVYVGDLVRFEHLRRWDD